MLIKASTLTVLVNDLDLSVNFYESIGFSLAARRGQNYALLETAGLTIALHPTEEPDLGSDTVSIGFTIDRLEEARTLLELQGILYEADEDRNGNYLHFADLDGTFLYFVQPK